VKQVLDVLGQSVCLDLDAVYAMGESNGGMMAHHLAREMPAAFAGILPLYGLPLQGVTAARGKLPSPLRSTSFFQWHDRWDNVIPTDGAVSSQGWLYDTLNETIAQWVDLHGCSGSSVPMDAPTGGSLDIDRRIECRQWPDCSSGQLVALCYFDGLHGNWIEDAVFELSFWWLVEQQQQRRQQRWRWQQQQQQQQRRTQEVAV
jgi:poly(3-hydroxybutyrate) depolymerase